MREHVDLGRERPRASVASCHTRTGSPVDPPLVSLVERRSPAASGRGASPTPAGSSRGSRDREGGQVGVGRDALPTDGIVVAPTRGGPQRAARSVASASAGRAARVRFPSQPRPTPARAARRRGARPTTAHGARPPAREAGRGRAFVGLHRGWPRVDATAARFCCPSFACRGILSGHGMAPDASRRRRSTSPS